MVSVSKCQHCGTLGKPKVRDISQVGWELLMSMGEVEKSTINMPICDACFKEFRELIIENRMAEEKGLVAEMA